MTDTKALAKVAKTGTALVAPETLIPEILAEKGIVTATSVLTGDIVVVRVAYPRGTKKKPLPAMEVEYHVNAAAIGIGAFFLALGALGAAIAWNGVQTFGGGLRGLKDSRPGGGTGGSNPSLFDSGVAILKHLFGLP